MIIDYSHVKEDILPAVIPEVLGPDAQSCIILSVGGSAVERLTT